MNKNQIIEIIKQNPKMTHEEIKSQAENAGVPIEIFEDAWNETKPKKSKKRIGIKIVGFVLIVIILFLVGIIPVRMKGKWVKFYFSGNKSSNDCIKISNKYAKKWNDDYRIDGVTIGFQNPDGTITTDKNGYSKECETYYYAKNGNEGLNIYMSKYFLGKAKHIHKTNKLEKYNKLSNPTFLNSNEIIKFANKYNNSNKTIMIQGINYAEKYNKYIWIIGFSLKEKIDFYFLDAISGDSIGKE